MGPDDLPRSGKNYRRKEERLAMIKARRDRLMEEDRKKGQEAWLANEREQEAGDAVADRPAE